MNNSWIIKECLLTAIISHIFIALIIIANIWHLKFNLIISRNYMLPNLLELPCSLIVKPGVNIWHLSDGTGILMMQLASGNRNIICFVNVCSIKFFKHSLISSIFLMWLSRFTHNKLNYAGKHTWLFLILLFHIVSRRLLIIRVFMLLLLFIILILSLLLFFNLSHYFLLLLSPNGSLISKNYGLRIYRLFKNFRHNIKKLSLEKLLFNLCYPWFKLFIYIWNHPVKKIVIRSFFIL